jgi:putative ABC transport system permease protein
MQDFRYAVRLLRRQPRFTALMVLTIALGVGATTVLFSVAYGVLMKPLQWPNAGRIVVLHETRGGNPPRFGAFTNTAYLAWRGEASTVDSMAAWSERLATLSGAGEPERIRITAATASLFSVLGARPLIGSFFTERDETSPLVVISEGLWRRRFGGAPSALGRGLELDGVVYTISGVLADRLMFPTGQASAVVPFAVQPSAGNSLSTFNALAVLRPGATPDQAAAEATARGRFAADTGLTTTALFGSNGPIRVTAESLLDSLTAHVRRPLLVLLVAVGLLLATATANVAGLQLARATTRTREIAIRTALGAGRARVTRQLLVEGLLVGIAGGVAGLGLAWLLHRLMPSVLPADFPRAGDFVVDSVVMTFALVLSVAASILAGLLPARRARQLDIVRALAAEGGASGMGGRSPARARMLIMAGQVAVACVLLVGASLLGRSFFALLTADRGYDPRGILSARLSMPSSMYPSAERRFAIVDRIVERLSGVSGVVDAAFTSELPLTPGGSTSAFTMRSPRGEGVVEVQASPRIVSPRYFAALGMRIVAGRGFSERDTAASEPVVVVNRAFARKFLGESPLGAKVPLAGYGPPDGAIVETTVIGVVDEVRYVTAGDTSQPELFYSHRQMKGRLPVNTVTLLARTSGDPRAAAGALRLAAREADDRLAVDAVMPLEQRVLVTLAQPRLYAVLVGGFALFALLVAAVGLFGLLSYSVSQRARELAIRAALGARRSDILSLVLRQAFAVILMGLTAGMLAAAWFAGLLSTQLYGIAQYDLVTFTAVPLLLLAAGAVACLVPARRAVRLQPWRVLGRY